jgi:hypothetical protein
VDGTTLYPVPVRMLNYRESGQKVSPPLRFVSFFGHRLIVRQVNTDTVSTNDVLTRRFFISDVVSGVSTTGGTPVVVRFAQSVQIMCVLYFVSSSV